VYWRSDGKGGGGGQFTAEDYTFFYGQGNGDLPLGTGFFIYKRIVLAVRRVEFISDRMLYIILRGRWYNIIVLNVDAPVKIRGMRKRTASLRSCGVCLISFLGMILK
jgi:hypothetical protein